MYNLGTVIRFEITRALKKKSFWIMALGFPVMMGAIFSIIYLSNDSTSKAAEKLGKEKFSMQVTDDSHLVNPAMLAAMGAKPADSKSAGVAAVKSGKVDAYIYYPKDLTKEKVEVYGQDVGFFENGRYGGVADMLLKGSVEQQVDPNVSVVVQGRTNVENVIYRDGAEYKAFEEMIFPGIFLILFYMLIAFFGNQMLVSTTEEKENRVIEMILTTIEARTLIIGKIVSLIALAFLQGLLIVLPALIGYLLFQEQLKLPAIDLSSLPVNWARIGLGAGIFALSFVFFTGVLVLIGASVPTAKEAGGFIGLIMMLIFGPLYAFSLFLSAPESPFVRFMTLFPLTAPIPLLLRNAVGNLEWWELALAFPILAVSAIVALTLAVRVFRFGALEYSRKVSVKEILFRK